MTADELRIRIKGHSEEAQAILTAANGGAVPEDKFEKLSALDAEVKADEAQLSRIEHQLELGSRFSAALTKAGEMSAKPAGRSNGSSSRSSSEQLTIGDAFVEGEEYKSLIQSRSFQGRFKIASTIDTKAIVSYPAGGVASGALMPAPPSYQYSYVADLPAQARADGGMVPALIETAPLTSSAQPVAPGALKPEASWTYAQTYFPLVTIAHWLRVPDQLLEDASALRGYLNSQLAFGVRQREDDQVVNGTGTAPAMLGFLPMPGKQGDVANAGEPMSVTILSAIAKVESSGMAFVDGIVLNPETWALVLTEQNAAGLPLVPGLSPLDPFPMRLWGRRVATTPFIAAGTALVGAFSMYSIVFRGHNVTVSASNEDQDNFVRNLTTIRAESRLVLVVTRPPAFGTASGLDGIAVTRGGEARKPAR